MCTTSRMIYILTYRALREFSSGRKSINPIVEMQRMETSVPFSICAHTHQVMMMANRSFNQRHLAPVGVHEPLVHHNRLCNKTLNEISHLRLLKGATETIHARLHFMRNKAYAMRATGWGIWHYPLYKLDCKADWVKATTLFREMPLFA